MAPVPTTLTDEELFAEISKRRANGEDVRTQVGELVRRWRQPAGAVVRRIQKSYLRGSPDDEGDIFQEAVAKFIARGLDQFRGQSIEQPGTAAAPLAFFLRIVKHVAIDRYRRQREQLAPDRDEDAPEEPREIERAVTGSRRAEEQKEASELYWSAFARLEKEHPNEAAAWDLYRHQDVEDHNECARILNITVANSYKRVSRAQAYLKTYLLELMDESPAKQGKQPI
jgi:RNA polymerase sigma-70 factor (ECF subfamily)